MNLQHPSDSKRRTTTQNAGRNHGSLAVKILCVLAAFLLWVYVMTVESPEYETIFSDVTVDLENEENLTGYGLAIYNGYGNMIDVTLAGKKSILSKMDSTDIVATVDVGTRSTSGRYDCAITVDVPAGCKLVGTSQKSISVYIDNSDKKNVDLRAKVENLNLTEGYELGNIELPFDKVTVDGAKRTIDRIAVAVAQFDLTDVKSTTTKNAKIILIDEYGKVIDDNYIDFSPREVEAEIPLLKSVEVPIEVVFKYGYLNDENTTMNLSVGSVVVSGDPAVIDRGITIDPIEIDEKTDFDEDGVCEMTVPLDPPAGLKYSSDSVDVVVARSEDLKTREIIVLSENIIESGAPGNVNYTIDKNSVPVTIMGTFNDISSIDRNDITLWLDMSPYDETVTGTVKVRARVLIDSVNSSSVLDIGTYDINVTFHN